MASSSCLSHCRSAVTRCTSRAESAAWGSSSKRLTISISFPSSTRDDDGGRAGRRRVRHALFAPLELERCGWAMGDPLLIAYHDEEWGVPAHDDRVLFEFLVLEGAQAGLSWMTILRKRQNYQLVYDGFDPEKVARYSKARIGRLMSDEGIVRNRL